MISRRTLIQTSGAAALAAFAVSPHKAVLAQDGSTAGTLRIAATANAAGFTLDPHFNYGVSTIGLFTYFVWAGLTKMDEQLNVVPDIATSWDLSEDGLTYTFHIDPERQFSDGTPITANDVSWSWLRSLDPATQSLVAGGYLKDVVGAADYWQGTSPDLPTGINVVDDLTLEVTLTEPRNFFPEVLIHPCTFVIKQADFEAGSTDNPWWTIATAFSGPFGIESYSPGQTLELVANPNYPVAQSLDRVSYRLVEDAATQFLLYQNDEVDLTSIAIPDADNIKTSDDTYLAELLEVPQWWENNLYFRQEIAPFEDEQVRRAFMLAIDKDAIVSGVLQDLNPRIDGLFYPGMDAFNESLVPIPFDAEAAVAELAASTYGGPEGLPTIAFYTSPTMGGTETRVLAVLQEMWNQVLGVEVEIRSVPTYEEMLQSDVQIVLSGEAMHYPDASNAVGYLRADSGANIAQFADEAWEDMVNQAEITTDPEESIRLYREAEQFVLDRAALYPFYQVVAFFLVKPNVQGITPTAMYTFPNLDQVSIGG